MPSNVPNRHTNQLLLRWLIGGVLLVAGLIGALWYNEHRAISWKDTLDPFYWWRRWHNEDLYLPQQDLLLHGNHQLPEVALTFDDGPHPQSLPSILATLQRFHVHATFFDVGENMAAYPNLVRETLAQGNEIGNHTSTHLRLPRLSPLELHHEINDADITFYRITGQHLYLLRPPGMDYNDRVLAEAKQMGYIVVGYTVGAKDFVTDESASFIAHRTLDRLENGSILLLHDYPDTARALPSILEGLAKRGYHVVTISEMIAHLPLKPRLAAVQFLRQQGDPYFGPMVASCGTNLVSPSVVKVRMKKEYKLSQSN
ncbi:predicted xylanase/chitin deacetylase [Chthonomonas calidirosea]|nr:predicted xylanase/chitin deacetylase [Chthonomonas calidirosea]